MRDLLYECEEVKSSPSVICKAPTIWSKQEGGTCKGAGFENANGEAYGECSQQVTVRGLMSMNRWFMMTYGFSIIHRARPFVSVTLYARQVCLKRYTKQMSSS